MTAARGRSGPRGPHHGPGRRRRALTPGPSAPADPRPALGDGSHGAAREPVELRHRAPWACPSRPATSPSSASSACPSAPSSRTTSSTSTRRTADWPAWPASSATRTATSGRSWSSTPSTTVTPATSASASSSTSCATAPDGARRASTWPAPTGAATWSSSCRPASRATARSPSSTARPAQRFPVLRGLDAGRLRIRPAASAGRPGAGAPLPPRHARSRGPPGGLPPARLGAPRTIARACRARRSRPSCASPTWRPTSRRARRAGDGLAAMLQVGVAKEQQPHYLRVLSLPEHDPSDLIRYGLALIGRHGGAAGSADARAAPRRGVLRADLRIAHRPAPRGAGHASIARVSLLIKEALVRVAEPALVPAV